MKAKLRAMPGTEEGGERQGDGGSGVVLGGSAIVWLPCTEKKLHVFLKAQESAVRRDSGGERGEEAVRAATKQTSHLTHSCKTTRKAGLFFHPICCGFYSSHLVGIWEIYSLCVALFYHQMRKQEYLLRSRGSGMLCMK